MKPITIAICSAALLLIASGYSNAAGIRRELTPEERLIYMQQEHGPQWRALDVQQRCARRQQIRQQWATMNPAELQKLKQQLDTRWNAMPAAERQRIEQRIADRRTRPARSSGQAHRALCGEAVSQ